MKRKGFTLMELLLVVATLAIVSAAVAPTFTEGVGEALEEAKKSSMKSAYMEAVFGANLMMSVLLPRYERTGSFSNNYKNQFLPVGLSLDARNQFKLKNDKTSLARNLNYYIPVGKRVFYNLKGKEYFISAKIGKNKTIVLYYVDPKLNTNGDQQKTIEFFHGSAENSTNKEENHEIMSGNPQAFKSLDALWDAIKNVAP